MPSTASPESSPTKGPVPGSHKWSPLSIDLTSLPPLIQPSPPSNTLLITNLNNPATFHKDNLERIRVLLSQPTPLNSFSPLRSFRRIVVSYPTIDSAIYTRQLLDGTSTSSLSSTNDSSSAPAHTQEPNVTAEKRDTYSPVKVSVPITQPPNQDTGGYTASKRKSDRIRIYFGEPTPVHGVDIPHLTTDADLDSEEEREHRRRLEEWDSNRHLKAPALGKLFFISPPPSPPCGWEIRAEDPPNKITHAEDLQRALAGLMTGNDDSQASHDIDEEMRDVGDSIRQSPIQQGEKTDLKRPQRDTDGKAEDGIDEATRPKSQGRGRSSTLVYHPKDHSARDDLPAVMVVDMTGDDDLALDQDRNADGKQPDKKIFAHTARPPVELMH